MKHALALLLLTGCYAEPPPPASPTDLTGCSAGAHGFLAGPRCASDRDCVLCGAADECGVVRTRREIALANPACPAPDPERCAGASAACCGGRCVLSLGPPAF